MKIFENAIYNLIKYKAVKDRISFFKDLLEHLLQQNKLHRLRNTSNYVEKATIYFLRDKLRKLEAGA